MEQQKYPGAKALLEKFHAGQCTPEELALLDEWYANLGDPAAAQLPVEAADAQREAFLERFRTATAPQKVVRMMPPAAKRLLAASILLLVGLALAWLYLRRTPQVTPVATALVVENGSGSIKKVTLPDSSEVWLNANASLRWNEDPANKERHLELTGEAFFDVEGSSDHPFILHTRDFTVRVLGTTFSVEAYPQENMSRVSLVSGKVKVCSNADSSVATMLQPGFAATVGKGDSLMLVAAADTSAASWKEGGFAVSALSVRDAVTRLCGRYGYTVRWENTHHLNKQITVALPAQPFEDMLGSLCYMNHKRFSISGKLVTIH